MLFELEPSSVIWARVWSALAGALRNPAGVARNLALKSRLRPRGRRALCQLGQLGVILAQDLRRRIRWGGKFGFIEELSGIPVKAGFSGLLPAPDTTSWLCRAKAG